MQSVEKLKRATCAYGFLMLLYFLSSCIQAFPMVSVGALLNQQLKFTASELALYYASIFIPWNFRAIYGLISDTIPFLGYRRKPYMLIGYFGTSISYAVYGTLVDSVSNAFIVGIVLNVFFSLSESVLDATTIDRLRVEESRECVDAHDDSDLTNIRGSCDIQSAAMTFRTLGSLVSFLAAGGLSALGISPRMIIGFSALFPFISCLTVLWGLKEVKLGNEMEPVFEKTRKFFDYIRTCYKDRKYPTEFLQTARPVVLPCVFILLYASCPSSNVVFVNYLYSLSSFDQWEFHMITLCGILGGLVGTLSYWKSFRNTRDIRRVFVISVFISILAACSRLLIVHGWNEFWFICVDEIFVNLALRFTLMPVQVYACIAASSAEHLMYEGFVFGLFASIENWGGTISGLISSGIADELSLVNMIIVCSCASIAPLFALSLLRRPALTEKSSGPSDTVSESI